ncbi:MAG: AAA family ATPase [Geodermatophilaceae bacterium]|nr:AAA family ATPase [Geodermatophilaceae bacterium]
MLVVFGGLPGTGKTTLARSFARRRRASYVRVDAIESGLISAGLVPDQAGVGPAGYVVANRVAESCLLAGLDVVVDAVNALEIAREGWRTLAADLGIPVLFVEVVCSDLDEHRRRVEQRASDLAGWTLPDWDAVLERTYDPWLSGRLVIDNVGDPQTHVSVIAAAALTARQGEECRECGAEQAMDPGPPRE